ncbi:MAG: hypothetical protein LBR61_10975 [Synergistaceae bacterium]|nr:hypothetical protein [Synergistaceae bacterium]
MRQKDCIAMVNVDGRGAGAGILTTSLPKSMIYFGGGHRLIDFALSACSHAGLDVVGILSGAPDLALCSHIGDGRPWVSPGEESGVFILPSGQNEENGGGFVNAVRRNLAFIRRFSPEHVCLLPGDQVFRMDCAKMIEAHKNSDAAVTLAVVASSRRKYETGDMEKKGIIPTGFVLTGFYVFRLDALQKYLTLDGAEVKNWRNFGADVLPVMRQAGEKLQIWKFDGYRRELETAEDLWESGMDLLGNPSLFESAENGGKIIGGLMNAPSRFVEEELNVERSVLSGLQVIEGRVQSSILSDSVVVERGAEVVDSILMPNVYVGRNARIYRTIIGPNARLKRGVEIGEKEVGGVSVVAPWVRIAAETKFPAGSYIERGYFLEDPSSFRVNFVREYEKAKNFFRVIWRLEDPDSFSGTGYSPFYSGS